MKPVLLVALLAILSSSSLGGTRPVRIGSKAFTESVILGEIATQTVQGAGLPAEHRRELGGTQVLWRALRSGDIDAYVEYTGTIAEEIMAGRGLHGEDALRGALAAEHVRLSRPLGFNDTYALGMREDVADSLGIRTISDLRMHASVRYGFSHEFLDRADGWPALRTRYALSAARVRGLDHDLAYRGLADGAIDVTDLYSTDAEIAYYHLRVLEDDRAHFPEYQAVLLTRDDLPPRAAEALTTLEGRIDAPAMIAMNAEVKLRHASESDVARAFLARTGARAGGIADETPARRLARRTREHLVLVAISLAAAILVAIPLGIAAARHARLGHAILAGTGVLQTIPSLALLVFLIPLVGIGSVPAVIALFLYSLLPIVRNTHAGLTGIPRELREAAAAIGLPPRGRLLRVELPMASPAILAGIKTAAVINVGTATLGALIGAGGYGQSILTGIRLDRLSLILEGAIPAAVLALLVQFGFDQLERAVVPRGLRLVPHRSDA